MPPHPRLTPWITWDEWIDVRRGLFSSDWPRQIWAIEIIWMWRVRGRIPHSVDSSAQLVEIIMNDTNPMCVHACIPHRSETELRLMYAMTIVRAVNGLVDPSQQGYFADSVMSLATRIGLPTWFVDLRHDATHSHLPSLSILRIGATNLLKWYRVNYWDKQDSFLDLQSSCCFGASLPFESTRDTDCETVLLRSSTSATNILVPAFIRSISASMIAGSVDSRPAHVFARQQFAEWGDALQQWTTPGTAISDGQKAATIRSRESGTATTILPQQIPNDQGLQDDCVATVGVIVVNLVDAALTLSREAAVTCTVCAEHSSSDAELSNCRCKFVVQVFSWWVSTVTQAWSNLRVPVALAAVWMKHLEATTGGTANNRFLLTIKPLQDCLEEIFGHSWRNVSMCTNRPVSWSSGCDSCEGPPPKRSRVADGHVREPADDLVASGINGHIYDVDESGSWDCVQNSIPCKRPVAMALHRRSGWPLGATSGSTLVHRGGLDLLCIEEN